MSAEELQTESQQQRPPQPQSQCQPAMSPMTDGDNYHFVSPKKFLDMEVKLKNKEKKRKKKKKRPLHKSKMVTGYIIYASEIRKDVIKKYPDRDFGDISKLVGIEWKNLPIETKVAYEKRAQDQNAKSKAIALEAKKLAEATEERAKEFAAAQQAASISLPVNSNCNGYNSHSQDSPQSPHLVPSSPNGLQIQQTCYTQNHHTLMMKTAMQQPLHIIQHQQQPVATTVQYCNTSSPHMLQQSYLHSQSPPLQQQIQYQRNSIVYRKPATVRLRPKDATTQTDQVVRISQEPKKPLKFSQKFIDYLANNHRELL